LNVNTISDDCTEENKIWTVYTVDYVLPKKITSNRKARVFYL